MTTTLDHIKLADIQPAPSDDLTAQLQKRSTRALQDLSRAMGKEYDTKLFDFSRDERTNSKDRLTAFMRHVWRTEDFPLVMNRQEANGQAQEAKQNEANGAAAFESAIEEAAQEFNGQQHVMYKMPPRRVNGEFNVVLTSYWQENARKIEAIKAVRNVGGWGLREAKDIVEQQLRVYSSSLESFALATAAKLKSQGIPACVAYVDINGTETIKDASQANGAAKAIEATTYAKAPVIEAKPVVPAPVNDVAAQMAALLSQLTANSVSPATIEAAVQKAVKEALERHTVSHRIVTPELPPIDVGIQHKHFPKLLKMANARMRDGSRLNVWVHGPAGSGKTTAARNVAKALSLPFYFNGSIDQAYKLTGYCDAHGKYNTTAFRQAWEHGGVYLFDEIDGSSPTAFLELNAALANGLATFPDRADSVPRHKDCIIIAGANTIGLGGTIEYVGRMRLDAASLDRFVFLDWPIDEALERALCANVEWSAKVQASRGKLKTATIKGAMISPRATQYGEALLAAGLSEADVTSSVLRKGMPDAEWQKVRL